MISIDDNLDISYLLDNIDLWLWDWDDTLIDTKSYSVNKMQTEEIKKKTDSELDREVPGWRYFVNLVTLLINNGKKVGIVSFGTYDIIQDYMNRMFGNNNPFNKQNILTIKRDSNYVPLELKKDKNEFIDILLKKYNILPSRTILFDDLITNVIQAIKFGVLAIHLPNNNPDYLNSRVWKNPSLLFNSQTLKKSEKYIKKQICMRNKMIDTVENFTNRELWKQKFKKKFKDDNKKSKILLFCILSIMIISLISISLINF